MVRHSVTCVDIARRQSCAKKCSRDAVKQVTAAVMYNVLRVFVPHRANVVLASTSLIVQYMGHLYMHIMLCCELKKPFVCFRCVLCIKIH